MVKCEKGECVMTGSIIQLAAEVGCLVNEVYRKSTEFAGSKFAKDVLDTMFTTIISDNYVEIGVTEKPHMNIDIKSIMEALKNLED